MKLVEECNSLTGWLLYTSQPNQLLYYLAALRDSPTS